MTIPEGNNPLSIPNAVAQRRFIPRKYARSAVALPATLTFENGEYSARILNVAMGGALLECSAPLTPAAQIFLRCGSIAADSVVIWQNGSQFGVNFRFPLREEQVAEQLARNNAIISRQDKRESVTEKGLATDGRSQANSGDAISATYSLALEASQERVETHAFELGTIISDAAADTASLSGVRLALRKANLDRTQVALDACRHLMSTTSDPVRLLELQRKELDVSQTISQHVQFWTMPALQVDWAGYCVTTGAMLERIRELVGMEKHVLIPMLRAAS